MAKRKSLLSQEAKDAIKRARAQKKQAQQIAKSQIKEMRPYLKSLREIDLRKDISPQKRAAITKAWREYQELTTRPFKIYRTKNKDRLKVAQRFAQHDNTRTKFDVAFIPTVDPKAKIKFKKDRVIFSTKYADVSRMDFNLKRLAVDPGGEIKRVLDMYPNAKQFVVVVGKSLYNGGLARSLVEAKITNLMAQYSPGGNMYERRGPNSHWENWLFGLEVLDRKSVV